MPKVKTDKTEIILKSIILFRIKGYHACSMSDLATACGLQKGSFYHYFESKEALMSAVLEYVHIGLEQHVFSIAYEEETSTAERLQTMLKKLGKALLMHQGGCIIGNTTLETASNNGPFNQRLKAIFDDWIKALTHLFKSQYPEGTAARLARSTIMEFEGAVMFDQLYKSDEYVKEVYLKTIQKIQPNERSI